MLNYIHQIGFVYGKIRRLENGPEVGRGEVEVLRRLQARLLRQRQDRPRLRPPADPPVPAHPLYSLLVFFPYATRPVSCACCGRVQVERVPWADG